jgi:hypothetical protein
MYKVHYRYYGNWIKSSGVFNQTDANIYLNFLIKRGLNYALETVGRHEIKHKITNKEGGINHEVKNEIDYPDNDKRRYLTIEIYTLN